MMMINTLEDTLKERIRYLEDKLKENEDRISYNNSDIKYRNEENETIKKQIGDIKHILHG